MKQTPKVLLLAVVGGLILATLPSANAITAKKTTVKASATKKVVKKPVYAPRRIDGVADLKSKQNQWPIAVMIDNHTAARPQAGLSSASIVYEALAEGGIPRFMAVFVRTDMPYVGPVRSVRPYFVKWAAEYPAALAHAGGSPDGQELLKKLRLPNIEGTHGPTAKYFFRYVGRSPHNLFIRGSSLASFLRSKKYTKVSKPTYPAWNFSGDPALKNRPKGNRGITIDLGAGANYNIKYVYHRATNSYFRYTGGRLHLDRNGRKQIAPKNVIIQMVPKEKILDKKKRIDLQVTGKGKAILFRNGFTYTINWKKDTTRSRTRYYYQNGKEVTFTQGQTFITALPKGRKYTVFNR